MSEEQHRRGSAFRALHEGDDLFLMPNAWNAGSACMLEDAGFAAIGTTSAGFAYGLALPDYEEVLSRDAALAETRRIAQAVAVPVSADTENCYGHEPEVVADTIARFAATGVVGASIEDFAASWPGGLYERALAVERVRAARSAADALGFPFVLTARAECYLQDHPDPFNESVARVNAYREAGADCLYVPGVTDADTIGALVRAVDGPLNVVMGLSGGTLTVRGLEDLGVKRVSIGASLARATFGLIRRAAAEMRDQGSFRFADEQVPDDELCRFFAARRGSG